MTTTDPRSQAEASLERDYSGTGAITGAVGRRVGWALLDVADAIRDLADAIRSHRPTEVHVHPGRGDRPPRTYPR